MRGSSEIVGYGPATTEAGMPLRGDGSDLRWYAVHVCSRSEKLVAERLRYRSCEVFLPIYRVSRKWKNGLRVQVDLPLFPGYLFTKIPLSQGLQVQQVQGVVSLVGTASGPTPIPANEFEVLRVGLERARAEPHPFLAVGGRVRVIGGPLSGVEGILTRRKDGLRVVLSIELIMRSVSIEVGEEDIEPLAISRRSEQQVPSARVHRGAGHKAL